jgi:hypothetical protein
MWTHCLDGVQRFSFVKVNAVFGLAGVLATADHSVSNPVFLMCSSGDLMVILTNAHIVVGGADRVSTGFLCQVVWPSLV